MRAYAQDYLNDVVEIRVSFLILLLKVILIWIPKILLRPTWQAKQEKALMKPKPMLIQ